MEPKQVIYEMPELNPYESPQLVEGEGYSRGTDNDFDLDYLSSPEWKSVCRGAGHCYLAVIVIFDSILFAIIIAALTGGFQVGREIALIIGNYLFYAAVIFGWIIHWLGLIKLQKILYPRAARGYFTQSILAFFLCHAMFAFIVVWIMTRSMQNRNGDLHEVLIGTGLAMFGLHAAHMLTILSGLYKIGEVFSHGTMRKSAAKAFNALVAVIVIEALSLSTYFLELVRDFDVIRLLTMFAVLIGNGIVISYYASAMKQLSECDKLGKEKVAGAVPVP